jgi:hypothetical protein
MSFIKTRGEDAKPLLMFVLGFFMIPVCFALSIGPATWFSERGPDAKELPYHFGNGPLWVTPWLFYFSMLFHFLMWAGMCLFVVGISWFTLKRRRHA